MSCVFTCVHLCAERESISDGRNPQSLFGTNFLARVARFLTSTKRSVWQKTHKNVAYGRKRTARARKFYRNIHRCTPCSPLGRRAPGTMVVSASCQPGQGTTLRFSSAAFLRFKNTKRGRTSKSGRGTTMTTEGAPQRNLKGTSRNLKVGQRHYDSAWRGPLCGH